MGLKEYEKKRDFKKTSEPKGGKSDNKELSFVVQRHHASRLHYDFRLELDGTLKSWAVPKGPSLNPDDKRLAMMVEDHPIDYQHFEGIIPNGNYGAGVVLLWDNGTYESLAEDRKDDIKTLRAGLKAGNLKIRLKGKILNGEFALVKIKNSDEDNAWLLIKHNDEYAVNDFNSEDLVPDNVKKMLNNKDGKAKGLPKSHKVKTLKAEKKSPDETRESDDEPEEPANVGGQYRPMMAKPETKIFDDNDWIYERKLDGYRAIGYTGKKARLISRNNIDFSKDYKKVVDDLEKIGKDAIIDGELVIEDHEGRSRFQDIQNYKGDKKHLELKYYVFDLLNLDGHDLRNLELIKRKLLLEKLVKQYPSTTIIYSGHVEGKGSKLFEQAKDEEWEGIIGKDAHSFYVSGKRTDRWLKFKYQNSQEAIICGYTAPSGSRKHFGALILGINQGDHIKYIGNCGTGFNEASLKEMFVKMEPLETKEKPFAQKTHQRTKITWLKPKLVCEVWYSEWTADGHLRHPVFKGLRTDKKADEVVTETPGKQMADEEVIAYGRKKVKVSHLNKVYWPKEGITKGELIKYYESMADWIVPYLKDKPMSMRRQPNGIDDPGFFQKDNTAHLPDWIKTEKVYSESNDKDINYIVGGDAATLLYMANLGCIEINPWLSTYKKPEHPEYVVIDIDPHDVPFSWAVEAALKTKEVFDRMKLDVFVKTSGSKGLHIYCYLGGRYDYDFVKVFAEYVANLVHTELPDTTSVERSPAKRPKKVYIDFLQNRRGQTIACPYSVRPKPGATVSAPLHWNEVNDDLKLSDYTIYNIKERTENIDDPWKNIHKVKADLKKGLERLKNQDEIKL
ncbi:DNA ligase D [Mucilaginibacter hurinus]|uniref:DNA ligase (ATP) n=1 Tax=Mucilaginibacter hurinus TaxID=2201324 RepID=A0A367GSM1_9SPHI|nr:DNA ligase D [Mucilaginibacter hurinus]RCH55761.1 DNA ligase D [Mucilaginibacter hurinus]